MKHAIIGKGNLGLDLFETLKQADHEVEIFDRKNYCTDYSHFDVVWCCVGSGGPGHDFMTQVHSNILLTAELVARCSVKTRLVFFSSHYLNYDSSGKKSHYALSKKVLEDLAMKHGNAIIFRIGSLYGSHFIGRTFPGKIIPRLASGEQVHLPLNRITPTSTKWLADKLVKEMKFFHPSQIYSVGPISGMSVFDWGRMIVSTIGADPMLVQRKEFDENYPAESRGSHTEFDYRFHLLNETMWEDVIDVWKKYGDPIFKHPLHSR